jgi:hypothetical protein
MNKIDFFRKCWRLTTDQKARLEQMLSTYESYKLGVEHERELKEDIEKAQKKLKDFEAIIAREQKRQKELLEFFFMDTESHSDIGTKDKCISRLKYKGAFKGLNEDGQSAFFDEIDSSYKEFIRIKTFLSNTIPLDNLRDNLKRAEKNLKNYKLKTRPECYDNYVLELYFYIIGEDDTNE